MKIRLALSEPRQARRGGKPGRGHLIVARLQPPRRTTAAQTSALA